MLSRRSPCPPVLRLPLLLLASLSLTCGPSRNDGEGTMTEDPTRLISLEIRPANDVLLVDLNTEVTKDFTVRGYFANGTSADLTRKVRWSLDNTAVGRFVGPKFYSAQLGANKVDFTRVTAKFSDASVQVSGIANLTVVWLRTSGNSQDFFFSLPYQQPPKKQPLTFSTQVQSLDVFFAVDTTGSMGGEINQLSRSLQNVIIPQVKKAAAKDAWFGVGAIDDFPVSPYGSSNCNGGPDDQPLVLLQPMTDSLMDAQNGVAQLMRGGSTRGCGADTPEGQMEGLYQVATGAGNKVPGVVDVPSAKDKKLMGIGGAGFRDGALPVVVTISDASFHTVGEPGRNCGGALDYSGAVAMAAHDRKQTVEALNKICAKVVGISAITGGSEDCIATKDLISFANSTGAVVPPEAWDVPMRPNGCAPGKCCTGQQGVGEDPDAKGLCPLVFKIPSDGSGLGEQVSGGISQLARFASFDVITDTQGMLQGEKGETLPAGKTTADFIKSILPLDALPPPPPPLIPPPVVTEKGFAKVVPGSFVRFMVEAVNDMVQETSKPQVFHATIRVRAGGCANLDERDVIILIPPKAPNIG